MGKKETVVIGVRVEVEVKERLAAVAVEKGVALSDLCRRVLVGSLSIPFSGVPLSETFAIVRQEIRRMKSEGQSWKSLSDEFKRRCGIRLDKTGLKVLLLHDDDPSYMPGETEQEAPNGESDRTERVPGL